MALRLTLLNNDWTIAWVSASDADEDALVALLLDLSDDGPADLRVQGEGTLDHAQLRVLADRLRRARPDQPAPWSDVLLGAVLAHMAGRDEPLAWSTSYDTAGTVDSGREEFTTAAWP